MGGWAVASGPWAGGGDAHHDDRRVLGEVRILEAAWVRVLGALEPRPRARQRARAASRRAERGGVQPRIELAWVVVVALSRDGGPNV